MREIESLDKDAPDASAKCAEVSPMLTLGDLALLPFEAPVTRLSIVLLLLHDRAGHVETVLVGE